MVSRKNFQFEIGYDEAGLVVIANHQPTGWRRQARPKPGESIPFVQQRLMREMLDEFFNEKDYEMSVGRCSVDGQNGSFFSVVHRPTKRGKSINTIENPGERMRHEKVLDELVEELWRDGLLLRRKSNGAGTES